MPAMLTPDYNSVRAGKKKPLPQDLEAPYRLHNKSVEQQAGDYDTIMSGYKDLIGAYQPGGRFDISREFKDPTPFSYERSAETGQALSNLRTLGQTGGYTANELSDLRSRGISPIRAAYANALREMNRGVALAGGRSSNLNAARAKMAREQSEILSQQMDNVNAGIAERVAQNRVGLAPAFASAANSENTLANEMKARNAELMAQAQRDKLSINERMGGEIGQALQGMTNLYGTTPALANLYGKQAMEGTQLQQGIKESNQQMKNRRQGIYLGAMR